ncbi:MAG: hypothetical protein ACFB2X_17685 [Rivularia sp. (in: cyanobacteria)]
MAIAFPFGENDGHTRVKEKDDCSGSFTVATEHYQSNERLQAPTSRSLQTIFFRSD